MGLDTQKKKELLETYGRHDSDTGSPEAQVALINTRIRELTEHLQTHRKDHHSRYGLFKLVGKQRRLLQYLYNEDYQRYRRLIEQLGIREIIARKN